VVAITAFPTMMAAGIVAMAGFMATTMLRRNADGIPVSEIIIAPEIHITEVLSKRHVVRPSNIIALNFPKLVGTAK
jgi:hypothetical protein